MTELRANRSVKKKVAATSDGQMMSLFDWGSLDKWMMLSAVMLVAISLVMIYSASIDLHVRYSNLSSDFFIRKYLYILAISVFFFVLCVYFDMNFWRSKASLILIFAIAALFLVLIVGDQVNGSKRWIKLGFFNVQPAEIAKFAMAIYAAYYVDKKIRNNMTGSFLWSVIPMGVVVGLIAILLHLEPDLGSAVVITVIAFAILGLGGVKITGILVVGFLALIIFLSSIIFTPWRMERIFAFIEPWSPENALGKGYQLTHSLIALGRGEFSGVGPGLGVEKFNWLPEAHTDFIFAVIGEELGFIGITALVVIYWLLLIRMIKIGAFAIRRDDVFSGLVVFGITAWFALQSFFHMGVNFGILPTKGITLPMISYGGSALILNFIALAVVCRVNFENQRIVNK